ncbi:MAG TPA: hypothetical protein VND64_32480 [Pirellulales bacterium]|nr:hypothetical protein [Pirellulales bacterium]
MNWRHRRRWLAVLYHHDCPKCLEALAAYEADVSPRTFSDGPIILIEVPPFAPVSPEAAAVRSRFAHGRLSEQMTWLVQTPLEVQLSQGVVVSVRRNGSQGSPASLAN